MIRLHATDGPYARIMARIGILTARSLVITVQVMSTSAFEEKSRSARAVSLVIGGEHFTVCLADGRRITTPYPCYPRLQTAGMKERRHFEICAEGRMLHWPDLDEDIEVQHLVEGRMPVRLDKDIMAVAEGQVTYGSRGPATRARRSALKAGR